MVITPDSNVKLIKCPLELNQNQQLDFANANAQFAYFNSLPKIEFDKFTYVHKDQAIRVPANIESIINYNYVIYWNENFGQKWFYCAIERMEFVNPNMTLVYIKTDVWQTWMFDLKMKQCFVEREHVADDTIGAHTVPEGLECGNYVINGNCGYSSLGDIDIIFQVTEILSDFNPPSEFGNGGNYNGIFSGLSLISAEDIPSARYVIQKYQAGKSDAIVSIFYAPKKITSYNSNQSFRDGNVKINFLKSVPVAQALGTITVTRPNQLGKLNGNRYTPKNNKLFTYPYCYTRLSNNVGQDAIYHYEDFASGTAQFSVTGALGQGCSIHAIPLNQYKGTNRSEGVYDYGIVATKLPILGWASDYYTNWETQQAINLPLQTINEGANAIGSFLSGNLGGTISSIFNMVTNATSQVYTAQLTPNQSRGNANSSDIVFSDGMANLVLTPYSIRAEYARIIDGYFDMYGYKVNTVKVPQWNSRPTWNYIKTIGATFEVDCPQEDAAELKRMFDEGLTIWHIPSRFGNYSYNNK